MRDLMPPPDVASFPVDELVALLRQVMDRYFEVPERLRRDLVLTFSIWELYGDEAVFRIVHVRSVTTAARSLGLAIPVSLDALDLAEAD